MRAFESELSAVSCTSPASCTAAGWYAPSSGGIAPLAEHWDGSTWTIQPTPNPAGSTDNYLNAVSCVSAASCTAVGQIGFFPYKILEAVSCVAAHECTAAGNSPTKHVIVPGSTGPLLAEGE